MTHGKGTSWPLADQGEMASDNGSNVGVAFALTAGAGMATVLGGMVIFSRRLLYLANPLTLAMALSISAGVMVFISLVEIYAKAVEAIATGIKTNDMAEKTAQGHGWLIATACFGGGIVLVYLIDMAIHKIAPENEITEIENLERIRESLADDALSESHKGSERFMEVRTPETSGSSDFAMDEAGRARLVRMGLLSALAIALHNLPEGIATYVGAIQDPSVGLSLAVGIGLHNIPEGVAVAAPIYFATGSKVKGIVWCAISALAEVFGGFLAWLAIGGGMNPLVEGIIFGLVCGIMVCISMKELIPTAFQLSGKRSHLVAVGSFIGMFIMVSSLILFGYAGA